MSRDWPAVTGRRPCRICAATRRCATSADGHVAKCTNVFDAPGAAKRGEDEVGEYAIYFADNVPGTVRQAYVVPTPASPLADVETRDRAYTALLALCPLSAEHHDALARRGLSPEEIVARGYATLPRGTRERTAMLAALGAQLGGIPADVPGLHHGKLPDGDGLLIPVRDADGRVVALKVRRDRGETRYVWLSSSAQGGASSGSPAHAPLAAREMLEHSDVRVVRLTEGPLKADVATSLSGVVTLAIPGAMAARSALPLLAAIAPTVIRLAWDADARTNPHVAAGLEHAAHLIAAELPGVAIDLETWPTTDGQPKGVDDALAAGAALAVHQGPAMWRELVAILRASGREPRPETLAHAGMDAEMRSGPSRSCSRRRSGARACRAGWSTRPAQTPAS